MADSRISCYHNLSTMLNAGMPIVRVFQTVHKRGRCGRAMRLLEQEVAAGSSLTDAVQTHQRRFEKLDRTLIAVGEQTGQTAEMFEMLAQWYEFRQRLQRQVVSGMVLPTLEIHAAAFIVPVVPFALGGWDPWVYWQGVLGILGFLFYSPLGVILAILYLTPKRGPIRWVFDFVVSLIPVLGKAVSELELSRYCKVFAITYKAGIPIVQSSQMALDAVNNSVIYRRLRGAHERVKMGEEMSKGFSSILPGEFRGIWEVGEESGDLDESAWRLGNMHADNAENLFTILSKMVPFCIYLFVIIVIVYFIFKGYSQIYQGLVF